MLNATLFILLWSAMLLGNVYKFSFFAPEVRFSALDIMVGLITIYAIFRSPGEWGKEANKQRDLITPIIIFGIIACASLLGAVATYGLPNALVGGLYLLRFVVYAGFFVSLLRAFNSVLLRIFIYLTGISTVVVSIGQYMMYPDIRSLQIAEWDPHYFRVVGTLLDPGFMGLILMFILLFLTLRPLRDLRLNFLAWLGAYLGLALTYSRSSFVAFLATFAYLSWQRKSWKLMLAITALFALTVVILPRSPDGEGVKLERTNSIQARIDNWQHALKIFSDHPILGVGFNVYRYAQHAYGYLGEEKWQTSHAGAGSDSSLLLVAATTGIIGLVGYGWYLWNLWKLIFLRPFVVGLFVHSFFLNSWFYPSVMLWIGLFIGYTLRSTLSESDSLQSQSL